MRLGFPVNYRGWGDPFVFLFGDVGNTFNVGLDFIMYGKLLWGGLTPPSCCCVAVKVDPPQAQMVSCCCVEGRVTPPLSYCCVGGSTPPWGFLVAAALEGLPP